MHTDIGQSDMLFNRRSCFGEYCLNRLKAVMEDMEIKRRHAMYPHIKPPPIWPQNFEYLLHNFIHWKSGKPVNASTDAWNAAEFAPNATYAAICQFTFFNSSIFIYNTHMFWFHDFYSVSFLNNQQVAAHLLNSINTWLLLLLCFLIKIFIYMFYQLVKETPQEQNRPIIIVTIHLPTGYGWLTYIHI